MRLSGLFKMVAVVVAMGGFAAAGIAQVADPTEPPIEHGDIQMTCPSPCEGTVNCNGSEKAMCAHGASPFIPK